MSKFFPKTFNSLETFEKDLRSFFAGICQTGSESEVLQCQSICLSMGGDFVGAIFEDALEERFPEVENV